MQGFPSPQPNHLLGPPKTTAFRLGFNMQIWGSKIFRHGGTESKEENPHIYQNVAFFLIIREPDFISSVLP
jgi:hypothetical protein